MFLIPLCWKTQWACPKRDTVPSDSQGSKGKEHRFRAHGHGRVAEAIRSQRRGKVCSAETLVRLIFRQGAGRISGRNQKGLEMRAGPPEGGGSGMQAASARARGPLGQGCAQYNLSPVVIITHLLRWKVGSVSPPVSQIWKLSQFKGL